MGRASTFVCDQCQKVELVSKRRGIPDRWFRGRFLDQWSAGSSMGGVTYKDKREVLFCSSSCMGKFASQAFLRFGENASVDKVRMEVKK